jgi:trehalose 6-phosphate synthase
MIASNRLPVTARMMEGRVHLAPSDGGLVRAMTSILRHNGGYWIGWPGPRSDNSVIGSLEHWASAENYSLAPVLLSEAEQNGYYLGFSNEVIWPLFHGFSTRCCFNFDYWNYYREVNARFASIIDEKLLPGDLVWIHDYHLMLVAAALNAKGRYRDLAYFHHIPFPPPDIFEILPWRVPILRALLQFNLVGFQTIRDQRNFVDCVRRCLPGARIQRLAEKYLVGTQDQSTTLGVYPISIDYEAFVTQASDPIVLERTKAINMSLGGAKLILSVDRLDYTKGVLERLSAYRMLLKRHAELRERVTLIQIVVPSREEIPEYRDLRLRIENLVSNINGEYGRPGWSPVQYFYRCISRTDLVAYYRAAAVASVTPLRDGMNLVAKEFCSCRGDNRGVLVLSEFAGAAEELRIGAFIVNPHDVEGFADVLYRALDLNDLEQAVRMRAMRARINTSDVYRWADTFVADCVSATEAGATGVAQVVSACS